MIEKHLWSLIFAIPVLLLTRWLAKTIPYKKQGFFCEDLEIRYPLYEDTVPSNFMFTSFLISSIIMIVAVEYTLIKTLSRAQRRILVKKPKFLHPGLQNILYFFLALTCSILTTSTILNLGKRATSRIRPNFLAVCQPDLAKLCPPNSFKYVDDYVCYGEYSQDQFFSFPSGHSCHSVNFAYYLQKRCKIPDPVRAFLQFFLFLMALFVCLSRIRDCKHRLSDVASGALIGLGTGIFYIKFVLRHYRLNRYRFEGDDENLVSRKSTERAITINETPTVISIPENSTRTLSPTTMQHLCKATSDYGSINNSSCENIYESTTNNLSSEIRKLNE